MRLVINTNFHGVDANLARALGVAPNVISRYFAPKEAIHHRPVGATMARRVEKIAHKPSGWMDHEHWPTKDVEKIAKPKGAYTLPDDVIELALLIKQLPKEEIELIRHVISVKLPKPIQPSKKRKNHR